jgi:hypothetical protein
MRDTQPGSVSVTLAQFDHAEKSVGQVTIGKALRSTEESRASDIRFSRKVDDQTTEL